MPSRRNTVAGRIAVALAALAISLAGGIAAPGVALADTPMWRYLGEQTKQGDAGEPNDAAYPYGGGDIEANVDASAGTVHTDVRATNNGNLAFSYSTNLRWSAPGSIEVGREQDVRISGNMSLGDFQIGVDPLNHPFLTEDHEAPKVRASFLMTLYKASGASAGPASELETYGGETSGGQGFSLGFDEEPGYVIESTGAADARAGMRIDDNYLWYPQHWDTEYQHDYDIYLDSWEGRSEDFVAQLKSLDGDGCWGATKSLPYETSEDTYYLVLSVDVPTAEFYVRYFYEYDPSANAAATVVPDEPEGEPEPDEPSEPYDVVIDTDAPEEAGESDLGEMPWWIFIAGGAAVAGATGAVVSSNNKRRKATQQQAWQTTQQPMPQQPHWQAPPQAEKPKGMSTFRMALYKDFGDTLYEGAPPQVVGALIEEVRPDGSVVDRPDMTENISFGTTDNISATAIGMRGPYQSIEVSVPKWRGEGDYGTVSIAYQGAGGRLTNNVRFKIEKPEIVMAPIGLTFVAGARQTLSTSFVLKGVVIPEGAEPVFEVEVSPSNIGPSQGAYFTNARVSRDAEEPGRLWTLTMTETGQKAQLPPGAMEIFNCHIKASVHHARGTQVVERDTEVFRFVEGLRLDVEDIKCYAVDEQERYVEFRTRRDDETIAEFKRKYVAWAGEGPSPTKDYTIPEERTRKVRVAACSVIKVTLYTWGTEMRDGQEVVRPMNPLPDFGATKISFADVEGSGTLRATDGTDTQMPCKTLELGYFLKEIDYDDNTMTYHVVPKRGVMLPPNRTQVDVTVSTSWNGRKFTETRRVNATSQPRREDFLEKESQYLARDAKMRQNLERIRDRILGSEWHKVEVGGDITLTDTVNDMVEFTAEHPVVANVPIVGPSINAGRTVWRQLTSKRVIEYSQFGELKPLAHQIQMMIDGYDERYGFHEPDYRRAVAIFEAYRQGQLGSAQAAELAMYAHDLEYCDAVRMTVKSWNHSYVMMGTRIAFALGTSGQSEWMFVPLAAIGAGMEGSIDYIDRGGNSLLEAFRIGCDRAGRSALLDVALGKAIEKGFQWAGWFKGLAEDITKAATSEAKTSLRQLANWFNSARSGGRVAGAARGLEGQVRQAKAVAAQAAAEFRASGAATNGEMLKRDINYVLGRLEGRAKVDELKRLIGEGAQELTRFERRQIIYAIQSDKHAMRSLMELSGPEGARLRSLFSREMAAAQERALHMTRVRIAERYGIPLEEVELVKTSGNKAADVAAGNKVSMDLDATFRRKVVDADGTVRWVDIDQGVGQPLFDEELFRVVHGYEAASAEEAAAFTKGADHTVVDALGAESYGTYEDAMRVVNASRAGEALDNPELVGQVAEYKCSEWLGLARQASEQAKAMSRAGDTKAAQWLASRSEAFIEESCRSFTKQADRIVTEKLLALKSRGIELGADIQPFLNKMEVLRNSGLGKVGGTGYTSAEVEGILKTKFNSSLSETYHELNELTVRLDGMLRNAK